MRRLPAVLAMVAATALALAFGVLVVLGSESGMYLAMGSDMGATSYSPSLALKLLALALFTAAVAWSAFASTVRPWLRGLVACLGFVVLALGTHTVIFNDLQGTIQEFWLLAKLDRAPYNIAEGVGMDWTVRTTTLGVDLVHKGTGRSVFVFCGIPPWDVDISTGLH
jgi:hypothetical protein